MEFWFKVVIVILIIIIVVQSVKLQLIRKSAREIKAAFAERLKEDTNTLIGISCNDKDMRALADAINVELRELRTQRLRFQQGDLEVKNAVTNISHDIRTPLTSICGYLELLEEETLSEKTAQYIEILKNRAQMLRGMTEELFDYSVDISTKLELKKEAVDVNRVLQESIAAFYTELSGCKMELQIHMPENRIIRQADAAALSRVFANFLSNAMKYSDGDLDIVLSESGEITFANTASGLNNIEVGKLFDRFYTVENARRSRGLGLSIAKLLVEKMEGEITAEYTDKRLVIHVVLPKADSD